MNKNAYKYEPNKHQETYENKTGKYIFNAGGYSFIVMSPQGEVFIFKKQSVYGSAKEGSLFHKMKNQFGIEQDFEMPIGYVRDNDSVSGLQSHLTHLYIAGHESEDGGFTLLKENSIPADIETIQNMSEDLNSNEIHTTV